MPPNWRKEKMSRRPHFCPSYEILHIETWHRDEGDESEIVWTRPPRPDDIPEDELPY